jgi:hypothetical protein
MMEVIVSVGIIATSIVVLLILFISLIKASQKSVDLAVGTTVAAGVIDKYIYSTSFDVIEQKIESSGASPICSGIAELNNGRFLYDITGKKVTAGQILRLDIAVWWWQSETSHRVGIRRGYGTLKRELTRFVTRKM